MTEDSVDPASEATGAATYYEPARSYASLWIFAALLGAGFLFDLILGGGTAHLPGWALAFVLVIGLNWLVVYAARSEKSVHLDANELRVGDDAVGRSEIVAVAAGIDEEDLPVLGWPTGKPRGLKGVTVRLFDGEDVIVPTRFPDRFIAALGLHTVHGPAAAQDVRAAARSEYAALAEIDERADAIFRTAGYDLPRIEFSPRMLTQAKAVFVAGRPPVGFVAVAEVDGLAHIEEIAVIPRWMRQGVGTRLLERACDWARARGYSAITLTTFADVPWNGPYYTSRGFVEFEASTPQLRARRERERELGLDEVARRVVMRRDLTEQAQEAQEGPEAQEDPEAQEG